MLCKICVMDIGDINILLGILMDIYMFIEVNCDVILSGS